MSDEGDEGGAEVVPGPEGSTPAKAALRYAEVESAAPELLPVAIAGIAYGGVLLLIQGCSTTYMLVRGASWWNRYPGDPWQGIVGLATEGLTVAAAVVLVVAGTACCSVRPWAFRPFLAACAALVGSPLLYFATVWLVELFSPGGGPASIMSQSRSERTVLGLLQLLTLLRGVMLPLLLIWFMTRPTVRASFVAPT